MKAIIKLSVLMLVIGAIGSITFGLLANDALKDELELTEVTYTYDKTRFSTIDLSFENNPVVILPSETDDIVITFNYDQYETVTETKTETGLGIKVTSKWYERLFFGSMVFNFNMFENRTVYVYLPVAQYSLHVSTSNGAIRLSDLSLGITTLRSSNGAITVKDSSFVGLLKNVTSNGTISLNNITAQIIENTTSNGPIILDNLTADTIKASSSNGRISGTNITSDYLTTSTSNGSIDLNINGAFADFKVKTRTSNGDVEINNQNYGNDTYHESKTPFVSAITSNGDIDLTFSLD